MPGAMRYLPFVLKLLPPVAVDKVLRLFGESSMMDNFQGRNGVAKKDE